MGTRGPATSAVFGDSFPTMQMIGCSAGDKLAGIVTTHQITCVWTHWSGSKTLGHVNGACPLCEAKIGFDFQAYCGFYNERTRHHRILRLTLGAVRQIADSLGTLNNVRGLMLKVERRKGQTNGRLMAETGMVYPDRGHLPQPFDVWEHLVRIWGLEYACTVSHRNGLAFDQLHPFSAELLKLFRGSGAEGALQGALPSKDEIDGQLHLPGSG